MEQALWSVEDKLNLTTQKAIALFSCTSLLALGLCLAIALFKRKKYRTKQVTIAGIRPGLAGPRVYPGRPTVVRVLMRAVRWSGPSKWELESFVRGSQREYSPTPLLVKRGNNGIIGEVGWQSHNSTSAVWQRPILMGEKCELPRFSGLILYDQRGMPVHDQCEQGDHILMQENSTNPAVRTTLRDLL